MKFQGIPQKLAELHKECVKHLPKGNRTGELSIAIKRGLPKLIIYEMKQEPNKDISLLGRKTSLNFANHFLDELSMFLSILAFAIDDDKETEKGICYDKADSTSYLYFLQKHTEDLGKLLNDPQKPELPELATSKDTLYMYFTILKLFACDIAHKNYLPDANEYHNYVFSHGITPFVSVLLRYGVEISGVIITATRQYCPSSCKLLHQVSHIENVIVYITY